jgi:hypothetical protein
MPLDRMRTRLLHLKDCSTGPLGKCRSGTGEGSGNIERLPAKCGRPLECVATIMFEHDGAVEGGCRIRTSAVVISESASQRNPESTLSTLLGVPLLSVSGVFLSAITATSPTVVTRARVSWVIGEMRDICHGLQPYMLRPGCADPGRAHGVGPAWGRGMTRRGGPRRHVSGLCSRIIQ